MLSMRDLMRVELSERGDEIKLLHEILTNTEKSYVGKR